MRSRAFSDTVSRRTDPLTDHVEESDLAWAARNAVALDKLVTNNGLSALAYFYKGEHGNEYEDIAANLIIGNTLLTSRGIPLAGEADLKTAAAMMILKSVGAGGSFAELHPFDIHDDIVLVGHDGPHNINISNEKPILRKLKKFHGKSGSGVSVEFKLKTGDVTLLSCSVDRTGSLKLISAVGESLPGAIPQTGQHQHQMPFFDPGLPLCRKMVCRRTDPSFGARRWKSHRRNRDFCAYGGYSAYQSSGGLAYVQL